MVVTQSERIAALEQRLTDHESRCEERLREIKHSAASTLKAVEGLKNRFWVIAVSLLAWAMAQVWAGNQARLAHLEASRPVAAEQVATAADLAPEPKPPVRAGNPDHGDGTKPRALRSRT